MASSRMYFSRRLAGIMLMLVIALASAAAATEPDGAAAAATQPDGTAAAATQPDGAAAAAAEPPAGEGAAAAGGEATATATAALTASLLSQVVYGPLPAPPQVPDPTVETDTYTRAGRRFACGGSEGLQCSGWLYSPKAPASPKPPVIVMAHGLGGQKAWLDRFAAAFAGAGFAVFSFDYRYWGGSQGEPRQWISVPRQLEDWRAAVAFARALPEVDGGRLSLWGTSLSGGHALTIAAELGAGVRSVVAQVPHLDAALSNGASLRDRGALADSILTGVALSDAAAKEGGDGRGTKYVPLAGPLGSLAIMQLTPEDFAQFDALRTPDPAQSGWRNLTRASFAADFVLNPYSPGKEAVPRITAPALVLATRQDSLCPYAAAQRAAAAAGKNLRLISYDGTHFTIYNPPLLATSLEAQVAFFKANAV